MTDYQGNSNRSKESTPPKKELEKVVTGGVQEQNKPLGSKFKNLFASRDFGGVLRYVAAEVLFPAARNAIVDATTRGVERAVFGDDPRDRRPGVGQRFGGHTTYHSSSIRARDPRDFVHLPDQGRARSASRGAGKDILFDNRKDAEAVVERIIDVINQYDVASVADLYELIDMQASYTDQNWGWTFFNDAEIRQTRDGWLLSLPPVDPIR